MKKPKHRLLIKQTGGKVIDTYESFHVACQEFPFKRLPEVKPLSARDLNDENGEIVFIPSDGLKFKAYDLTAKFIYVGSESDIRRDLESFISFLYGRNKGGSPVLSIYDEYTKTGRSGVYVQTVANDLYSVSDRDIDGIAIFSVGFRVTDPTSDIVLTK